MLVLLEELALKSLGGNDSSFILAFRFIFGYTTTVKETDSPLATFNTLLPTSLDPSCCDSFGMITSTTGSTTKQLFFLYQETEDVGVSILPAARPVEKKK